MDDTPIGPDTTPRIPMERMRRIEESAFELLAIISAVEWAEEWCPECHEHRTDGHAENCKLAAILAKLA